jgi:hypothetical protein
LIAVEHLPDTVATALGGLLGDSDAGRSAGEFDELVGAAWLLAGALLDSEAGGSRPGTRFLEFEDSVEHALAVPLDSDLKGLTLLMEEQRVHLRDLL